MTGRRGIQDEVRFAHFVCSGSVIQVSQYLTTPHFWSFSALLLPRPLLLRAALRVSSCNTRAALLFAKSRITAE